MNKHDREILGRVESKVDKIDAKLDMVFERSLKAETMAKGNRGIIRIIITGIITAFVAVGTLIGKWFIN